MIKIIKNTVGMMLVFVGIRLNFVGVCWNQKSMLLESRFFNVQIINKYKSIHYNYCWKRWKCFQLIFKMYIIEN